MKKIMIVFLMVGSSTYAMDMNSPEKSILHDLSQSDIPVVSASSDDPCAWAPQFQKKIHTWKLQKQKEYNQFLTESLDHQDFDNARSLMDSGAFLDETYTEITLIKSIIDENSKTFTFLLKQNLSESILQKALHAALDHGKRTEYAFQLLAKGALVSPESPAEKIAAYQAQLVQATEVPQPENVTLTTQSAAATHGHANNQTLEKIQSLWHELWN